MKQLTFLFLAFVLFSSCRKDFAHFQQSKSLVYSHPPKTITPELIIAPNETPLMASVDESPMFLAETDSFLPTAIATETAKIAPNDDDGRRRKKKKNINQSNGTFFERLFPNQVSKNKKLTKKKRNPVPINSTITTGFIILGIAILLALISLNSLSLLFGLAAIIFLYLGFKRYFRKKQRRNIFR